MFKGVDALSEAVKKQGMEILKIEDGQSRIVRILVPASDVMGVYEHTEQFGGSWKTITCLDKNENKKGECPICMAGKFPSFKAYIPVLDRTDGKVKIFKASKDVVKMLLTLVDEYGDLTDRDYKICRNGAKLQTTYQFIPKDKSAMDLSAFELPNILDRISPMPREAIIGMMNGGMAGTNESGAGDDGTADNGEAGAGAKTKHPF
jgi:hypothetical protein